MGSFIKGELNVRIAHNNNTFIKLLVEEKTNNEANFHCENIYLINPTLHLLQNYLYHLQRHLEVEDPAVENKKKIH
jgi:hypothetical protein